MSYSPRYAVDPPTRDEDNVAKVEGSKRYEDSGPALVVVRTLEDKTNEAHE